MTIRLLTLTVRLKLINLYDSKSIQNVFLKLYIYTEILKVKRDHFKLIIIKNNTIKI